MSGGSWEYVMANYAPEKEKYSGSAISTNSGYTGLLSDGSTFTGKDWLEDKYYNFYTTSDASTACNGENCKSHGLSETEGWYESYRSITTASLPWLVRGGCYGSGLTSSNFSFYHFDGKVEDSGSFRLVLSTN